MCAILAIVFNERRGVLNVLKQSLIDFIKTYVVGTQKNGWIIWGKELGHPDKS